MGTDATATVDPGWAALTRVAAGDTGAFAAIVETHQERLLHLCERLLGDPEDARDAAQEVFLKLFRKAADLRPLGQVYTLLYRIAVNHCFNQLRRRKLVRFLRFASEPEEPDAAVVDPADPSPDPAAELEARRSWQATRKAIAKLPDNQRTVLILARFEGLSYRQIAEVLGITEGAVESRLFRAMRRIEAVRAVGDAQEKDVARVPKSEGRR